jgi:hypothetical protein
LAIYYVQRNHAAKYFGYTSARYRCASVGLYEDLNGMINIPTIPVILKYLIQLNEKRGVVSAVEDFQYRLLELLVKHYIGSGDGLTWHRCVIQEKQDERRHLIQDLTNWTAFYIEAKEIVQKVTPFDEMEMGKCYYPSDASFPLVDMYWKDENGNLCGIQITKPLWHFNVEQVYKVFLEQKLGSVSTSFKFNLYYVIFPFQKYKLLEQNEFPFNQPITVPLDGYCTNVFFNLLCPPETFLCQL